MHPLPFHRMWWRLCKRMTSRRWLLFIDFLITCDIVALLFLLDESASIYTLYGIIQKTVSVICLVFLSILIYFSYKELKLSIELEEPREREKLIIEYLKKKLMKIGDEI